MNVSVILDVIRRLAPEENQDSWDNSGVQVLGEAENTSLVAVCLDPTPEAMRTALEKGAGVVLTHHPLWFEPFSLASPGSALELARMFLKAGAWLYAAHTSLDTRPGGPAFWLGSALGLRDTRVLEPLREERGEGSDEVGYGQVGRLPEPMPFAKFEELLAAALGTAAWRESGPRPETVSRVAYLPGSGSSAMRAAVDSGADVFITGDMKYHQALEAPLCVLDVGHHVLEEEMTRRLALELDEELADGATVFFIPSTDPFRHHG